MQEEREIRIQALFEANYANLYLFALHLVEDEEEARDIVSDVFSSLWQQWCKSGLPANDPAPSYLYATVRNRCIDHLRHNQVKESYVRFVEYTTSKDCAEPDLYEQRISEISRLIDLLPEPGKAILDCCYFRKMTYKETAEHLGLTLVVVKKNMLKMFKMLREGLRKHNESV